MAEPSPAGETQLVRLQREATLLGQRLREGATVTTLCHENPDGDTIGAAVAMARAAQQLGCRSEIVSVDGIPPAFTYLTDGLSVSARPTLDPGLADAATLRRSIGWALSLRNADRGSLRRPSSTSITTSRTLRSAP